MSCSDTKAESKSIRGYLCSTIPNWPLSFPPLSCLVIPSPFVFTPQWGLFGAVTRETRELIRITRHPVPEWFRFILPLIFNSTHMLTSVGRWSILPVQFSAATCSIDLCAANARAFPSTGQPAALFIICLAAHFVSLHCTIYIGHICGSFCTCSACLIMTTEFHYPFEIRIVINLIYPYTDTYSAHKYSVDSANEAVCAWQLRHISSIMQLAKIFEFI